MVVAHGDEGGRGNTCFVSSTRRVPRFAEKGMPGEERWLDLQLKLLADIGLVGLPNAGKSSMLAALTRRDPRSPPIRSPPSSPTSARSSSASASW